MSAVFTQVDVRALAPRPRPIEESVTVGKDILELLTGSMYVDPLVIYREYIQNAADSIDEAREAGLMFNEEAGVVISFNHAERTIILRDNGASISAADFVHRLVNIGASQKRGKKLRGFRGVGRLSGLGHCQELIFRGRVEGEAKVSEVRWDGRALKEKMRDPNYSGDLATLVKDIVTQTRVPGDGYPERFFEVEMRKIIRSRNDILLNEEAVRNYISQVAPVPFSKEFSFAKAIEARLTNHGVRPPINITLNDGRGPIYHRVQDRIPFSDTVTDTIRGVDFIELRDSDDEICAVGWIADHSYSGSIPKRLGVGGVRLRVGDIQVGDEAILAPLFAEPRFAGWAVGDIHVLSSKILPNGRRDDFDATAAYIHLQGELSFHTKAITHRIRERSGQRNQLRSVQQHFGAVDVWLNAVAARSMPKIVLKVIQELSRSRLECVTKEAAKFAPGSEELLATNARVAQVAKMIEGLPAHGKGKGSNVLLNTDLEHPISMVLKTILSSTKTPDAGIELSLQVLKALETH
ncbi:molecular chaperone HtpG [Paraburkholderia silvatlantica]|uniref:Molecular chaperone HtpG n=1 Tax=Paraburkholderia silvatlantica TaxID=321895 RepID=A0A2V4U646_9BURK|nr:molecular chaperone Hsp90 [Paraburkholderia silvatlantica]PYE26364.1 molecular chaperone HtpG [Paraburkholderia silvatlantica]